jgi:hypothetical protein
MSRRAKKTKAGKTASIAAPPAPVCPRVAAHGPGRLYTLGRRADGYVCDTCGHAWQRPLPAGVQRARNPNPRPVPELFAFPRSLSTLFNQ